MVPETGNNYTLDYFQCCQNETNAPVFSLELLPMTMSDLGQSFLSVQRSNSALARRLSWLEHCWVPFPVRAHTEAAGLIPGQETTD